MNAPSDYKPLNELTGAIRAGAGLTLPEIWQTLHANAREWQSVPRNANFFDIREMLDDSDRQTLLMLQEIEAVQWEQVCNGSGWTAIGAIALSWCAGAQDLSRISDRWQLSGVPFSRDPLVRRTSGAIHPGCKPSVSLLSELVARLEGNVARISLCLAAWPDSFKNDLSPEVLETAPPQITGLLG